MCEQLCATEVFHCREFTDTLMKLYQMITLATTQQDVDAIKAEIERLLAQRQQQQQFFSPYAGEGNRKWCCKSSWKGDCGRKK